jgi:hypothetical protein
VAGGEAVEASHALVRWIRRDGGVWRLVDVALRWITPRNG